MILCNAWKLDDKELVMTKLKIFQNALVGILVLIAVVVSCSSQTYAQGAKKLARGKICSDPNVPCKTTGTFDPNDLPFQIPANANIWESVDFYAVILKSVKSPDDNCDTFVPEDARLEAQGLFSRMKVFSSRCTMGGSLYYSNVAPNVQFMAVYAGATKAQADRMLATVKETGKFPGANIRRMRVGFNGT